MNHAPWLLLWIGCVALGFAGGCGDECVEVRTDCAPLYEPTFDNVYHNTLAQSCAVGGSSCHTASGAQGGMSFVDADQAYRMLTGAIDDKQRVIAGDASCSLLVARIAAPEDEDVMPPGSRLPDNEVCSIVKWVEAGAAR